MLLNFYLRLDSSFWCNRADNGLCFENFSNFASCLCQEEGHRETLSKCFLNLTKNFPDRSEKYSQDLHILGPYIEIYHWFDLTLKGKDSSNFGVLWKPFKTWLGLTKKFKFFCHTWKMRCFHQSKPYVIDLNVPKTLFDHYQSNYIKMGQHFLMWQKSLKNFVNPSQILKVFCHRSK